MNALEFHNVAWRCLLIRANRKSKKCLANREVMHSIQDVLMQDYRSVAWRSKIVRFLPWPSILLISMTCWLVCQRHLALYDNAENYLKRILQVIPRLMQALGNKGSKKQVYISNNGVFKQRLYIFVSITASIRRTNDLLSTYAVDTRSFHSVRCGVPKHSSGPPGYFYSPLSRHRSPNVIPLYSLSMLPKVKTA